ncbi:MAG: CPBP family intramembrane metalloprotease domain-containing protein [Acidobacteria bacterium]|nr:MAG: CPBP family intramembrane metalloprotease domain-containing protein [Acidobacteriota bacterium]
MPTAARRRVIIFLVLTYALSSIFYVLIIARGKLSPLPVLGLMWCPGVAALITRLATQRNLRGTGWGWGKTRWQVLAYLVPAGLALVVYGLVWSTGIGGLSPRGLLESAKGLPVSIPVILALFATVGLLPSIVFALGEEIGWRGLLVPELAQMTSFTNTALLSGAAWAVYHFPLILFADYHGGAPKWFALPAFTWMAIACSFVVAWLRLKSGSLWPAVVLHASHNLFIQQIFDPLTQDRGITRYVTTEFGVGLALAYTVAAWYFWRRRGELPQAAEAAAPAAATVRMDVTSASR